MYGKVIQWYIHVCIFFRFFYLSVIVKHWVKFPVLHSRKDGRSSWEPEVADGAHPRKWPSETTARHSCPQGQEQWSFSLRSTHTYFLRKQHGQAWGPRGAGESSGWIHDYMSESEAAQEKAGVTLTLSTLAPVFDVDIAAGLVEPQGELCGVSPKIELPYDSVTPLLSIYPEKTITQRYTCTPIFIAALFTIAMTWKQPKCPSTDEWIKKMWYISTMGYLLFSH